MLNKKFPEIYNKGVQFAFPRDGYASWAASGPISKIYRRDMRSRLHRLNGAAEQSDPCRFHAGNPTTPLSGPPSNTFIHEHCRSRTWK